jgi:hypothetical protein
MIDNDLLKLARVESIYNRCNEFDLEREPTAVPERAV